MQTTTNTISVNYALKWRLKDKHNYQWSVCGKLFNVQTGRQKMKTVNGGSVGYWIGREFVILNDLRIRLELIQKEVLPF
jgi:hypothetical protein